VHASGSVTLRCEPEGFRDYAVKPAAAYYHDELRESVLPYEAVRTADDPDGTLSDFLQTTYEAGAELGGWDRGLEFDLAAAKNRS
jgi:hypothetical protein